MKKIILAIAMLLNSSWAFANMFCVIKSAEDSGRGGMLYEKELKTIDVDMTKNLVTELWEKSNISYSLIHIEGEGEGLNFVIQDNSEAREAPRSIKPLASVWFPPDQKEFRYFDHLAGLAFFCSRK